MFVYVHFPSEKKERKRKILERKLGKIYVILPSFSRN